MRLDGQEAPALFDSLGAVPAAARLRRQMRGFGLPGATRYLPVKTEVRT